MKKICIVLMIGIMAFSNSITAKASYADEWLARKQKEQAKYMQELDKDGNLTEDVKESITKSKNKKENKEKKNKESSSQEAKGWVYSTDELHIVGLPEDSETGYTKSGNYGQID